MTNKFDAEDKPLGDILNGKEIFKIPRYQRPYTWSEDQVADLWNDLKDEDFSFLGSFVFNYENYEKTGNVEVIDGQQRLITLTILLAVVRDTYKVLGELEKANLTQLTIGEKDRITAEPKFRLKCDEELNDFFSMNIQNENSNILGIKPKNKEEKRIKEVYQFLKEQLANALGQYSEKSKKIKYLDEVKKKVFESRVILVSIDNDENAYSIFETVNARGADLTAADLLKNHLFQRLPKQEEGIDFAKEAWLTIENNIEKAEGPLNVSKFIRYYWLSKYSFIPEKRLYKEVKKSMSDPKNFVTDLSAASDYYYKIANNSVGEEVWSGEFEEKRVGKKIYESLKGLRMMGITQCYSLLFCLLMNKEKIGYNYSEIIKTIEKYHFVYSAVCKLSGNVVERVYFNAAKKIQEDLKIENMEKRTHAIQKTLSNFVNSLQYPSRDFFVEKFMEIEYKNYPLVIYILSNIERVTKRLEETDWIFTKVNIEHILPQDPSEWGLNQTDVKEYVNKLGNLTLLAKALNGPAGKKTLDEKVKFYAKSSLIINKELLKKVKKLKYKWTETEINERQRALAEFAYDVVWKFK